MRFAKNSTIEECQKSKYALSQYVDKGTPEWVLMKKVGLKIPGTCF